MLVEARRLQVGTEAENGSHSRQLSWHDINIQRKSGNAFVETKETSYRNKQLKRSTAKTQGSSVEAGMLTKVTTSSSAT